MGFRIPKLLYIYKHSAGSFHQAYAHKPLVSEEYCHNAIWKVHFTSIVFNFCKVVIKFGPTYIST